MEWSSKPQHRDQPFGSWADDLAAAFVRLEPRKLADQPFEGSISRKTAAPLQVSLVKATRHSVLRLASHIAAGTDDLCFVNLQLEGLGRTTQRGHEQITGSGDLAIADTTEPFEISNCRSFRLFCFAVPRHLVPAALFDRPRLKLSATESGRALSRTLAGYADLCLSADLGLNAPGAGLAGTIGAHVVDANGDLAGGSSRSDGGGRTGPLTKHAQATTRSHDGSDPIRPSGNRLRKSALS